MTTLEKLDKLFKERYSEKLENLNKNIYIIPIVEGTFEVPVPTLGGGGGTLLTGNVAAKLNPPAVARVENKRVESVTAVYRIAVTRYEADIAADKPEYFNYLFDAIVNKAIANYNATFGGENKVRFGTNYCQIHQDSKGSIFTDLDGGDHLEFRLTGTWASDKVVPKIGG